MQVDQEMLFEIILVSNPSIGDLELDTLLTTLLLGRQLS